MNLQHAAILRRLDCGTARSRSEIVIDSVRYLYWDHTFDQRVAGSILDGLVKDGLVIKIMDKFAITAIGSESLRGFKREVLNFMAGVR